MATSHSPTHSPVQVVELFPKARVGMRGSPKKITCILTLPRTNIFPWPIWRVIVMFHEVSFYGFVVGEQGAFSDNFLFDADLVTQIKLNIVNIWP